MNYEGSRLKYTFSLKAEISGFLYKNVTENYRCHLLVGKGRDKGLKISFSSKWVLSLCISQNCSCVTISLVLKTKEPICRVLKGGPEWHFQTPGLNSSRRSSEARYNNRF